MTSKNTKKIFLFTAAALLAAGCGKDDSANYSKYVKLADYKDLTVERVVTTVTDEDVQAEIEAVLSDDAEYTEISDRGAQNGDLISIDYIGTVDGAEFDGGSATEYEMELGTDSFFVEGFEEGIIGMKPGDTRDITVTFPEEYDGELDGKEAVFSVTLNSIFKVTMPEYTDEYVSTISGYSTITEYEASVKEELQDMNNEDAQVMACESALYQVIENSTISGYPEELFDSSKTQIESENQAFAEMFGVSDISEIFGEDYDIESIINDTVNEKMVVSEIARAEKITVTDEEIDAALEEELLYTEYATVDELKENTDLEQMRYTVLYQKVLDFLGETCIFVDVPEAEYYGEETSEGEVYEEDSEETSTEEESESINEDEELVVEELEDDAVSEEDTEEAE